MTNFPQDHYGRGDRPFDEVVGRPVPRDIAFSEVKYTPLPESALKQPDLGDGEVLSGQPRLPENLDALDAALLGIESAAALSRRKDELKAEKPIQQPVDPVAALQAYVEAGMRRDPAQLVRAGTALRTTNQNAHVGHDPLALAAMEQKKYKK